MAGQTQCIHREFPFIFQQKLPSADFTHAYLCRRRLKRVVVQGDHLEVPEVPVTDRDYCDFIAGEVEPYQRHLCQLCMEAAEGTITEILKLVFKHASS